MNGTTNALIADLHDDERRRNATLNLLGVFFGFGALFLPFFIGALVESLGLETILNVTAVLALLPAVLFAALRFPAARAREAAPFGEAVRLARHPLVAATGLLLFFQSGNEFIVGGYASTFLTRELGSTVSDASYLLGLYWTALMATRILLSRLLLQVPGAAAVAVSAAVSAVAAAMLAGAGSPAAAGVALALTGAGFASIFPTTLGAAGARFPGYSGTLFGLLIAMALVGGMTMPWIVGQVAEARGLRTGLLVAAGNAVLILAVQLFIERLHLRGPKV